MPHPPRNRGNFNLRCPPWPEPRSATSLRPPTAMKSVITEPQPLCAGRVSPHRPCPQGPFAPAVCYYRHHCSTAPCASLVPTSEFPALRLYHWPLDTRPSLRCIPGLATVPPPLRRRAPWGPSPDSSPQRSCLRRLTIGSALSTPQLPSRGVGNDAAAIPLCCGPAACSPSWAVPSCDGEGLILGAFTERSPNPGVRFATRLSGCCRDRSFPGWSEMFTGCTESLPRRDGRALAGC